MTTVHVTHNFLVKNYKALDAAGATCVSMWLECSLLPCLPSVRSQTAGSSAVRRGETTSTSFSVTYNLLSHLISMATHVAYCHTTQL